MHPPPACSKSQNQSLCGPGCVSLDFAQSILPSAPFFTLSCALINLGVYTRSSRYPLKMPASSTASSILLASAVFLPKGLVVITAFLCLQQSITASSCKLLGSAIQTISTSGWAMDSSMVVVQWLQP